MPRLNYLAIERLAENLRKSDDNFDFAGKEMPSPFTATSSSYQPKVYTLPVAKMQTRDDLIFNGMCRKKRKKHSLYLRIDGVPSSHVASVPSTEFFHMI